MIHSATEALRKIRTNIWDKPAETILNEIKMCNIYFSFGTRTMLQKYKTTACTSIFVNAVQWKPRF